MVRAGPGGHLRRHPDRRPRRRLRRRHRVRTQDELAAAGELPPWLGRDDLHLSHRSSLLRKDPAHYRPLFGDLPADLAYVWPASDREPACPLPPPH